MKIEIIKMLPIGVGAPPVGSVHEVTDVREGRYALMFIKYEGKRIGVYRHECKVVEQ